jgi:hypothetical protein
MKWVNSATPGPMKMNRSRPHESRCMSQPTQPQRVQECGADLNTGARP